MKTKICHEGFYIWYDEKCKWCVSAVDGNYDASGPTLLEAVSNLVGVLAARVRELEP
jgi:hypothetical protein